MKKRRKVFFTLGIMALCGVGAVLVSMRNSASSTAAVREFRPVRGALAVTIAASGTVYPKNRLEIKPPVSGRVERVMVTEGEQVTAGQIVAWMSSTERAALLDAASEQGEEQRRYWETIYKPIPLKAPMNGQVIVAMIQPGQSVTTAEAVIVLSDQLIVRAQVDETDIGKILRNGAARLSLDAYPDEKLAATVEHIYYESQVVNNVIIYRVDLVPERVPEFFRSGMSASIEFVVAEKDSIVLLPLEAVQQDKQGKYVWLKQRGAAQPVKRAVITGITDGEQWEISAGVSEEDTVVVMNQKFELPSAAGRNPFLPKMPTRRIGRGGPPL
ncbi:MAG: efflux RND transporter periplasmic adaptor subunit [Candidatus Omnitrophica bacterium]|nr:efflux RND transporter periplasmic adaptor subunit [Candidatus Omnitrophota bacterium]